MSVCILHVNCTYFFALSLLTTDNGPRIDSWGRYAVPESHQTLYCSDEIGGKFRGFGHILSAS